ncbi:unnamed protein product [Penicillium salamii]|uniref:Uncharacterized protein n=1 Tax=Penicillium salamii TaxID=1612424 RepID=A0A9W4IM40_9EURO|nr:unnamed protein product [Penicillium salamii]CAG7959687.1 unnamed protein product [Penicillium salamii]CAG7998379.1 unnamed protein product [Penicillium salamii]CAG8014795.1 unnamed protein product [Penicillium salamii]CAG8283866.1 unnamed protein product [Penicillium salamii]
MEASSSDAKPRLAPQCKTVHTHGSVDPKIYSSGCGILLCFIYHIIRDSSSTSNTIAALVFLLSNLFCFGTSAFCHYLLGPRKQQLSCSFLLDHIGIILHIWGTFVSVLLLENAGRGKQTLIILGVTLAGIFCITYLIIRRRGKKARTWVIGLFEALTLCSVSLYNAAFSSISRLTTSYIFLAAVNGIGGWFYCRGSYQISIPRSSMPYTVSGHSLMQLCSLIASIFHASTLTLSICI